MIAFLNGKLASRSSNLAYIDVGGVGYAAFMSTTALAKLPEVGSQVSILTYLHVAESGIALYGFLTEEEKLMFEKLIGVSGVGPKVALAALSTFSPAELARAVAVQDVACIQKIPGVGKKGASRIILELKGSFDVGFESLLEGGCGRSGAGANANMQGATEALLSMGFTSAEVDLALRDAAADATEEALLKYALKRLGSLE